MKQKNDLKSDLPLIDAVEKFFLAIIDSGTSIGIEALESTHQIIDQVEKLNQRLDQVRQQRKNQAMTRRIWRKEKSLEICRDFSEIGSESVKGLAQIFRTAHEELQDLGQQSDELMKGWVEPALSFSNPFRQAPRTKKNEPTIIPISIQDN